MKPFSFLSPVFCYASLHLLLFFTSNFECFGPNRAVALTLGNQSDHLALLQFKESISNDPYGILASWNSSTHFCNWYGITCSPVYQRVIQLDLEGYRLRGSISPYVGNLSFMINFYLENNSFSGKIPQQLGRLLQLRHLSLINNSFTGEIPTNLTNCSNLKEILLAGNNLIGKIPNEIESLQKLESFSVSRNNLTGGVPPFIGNLSSLTGIEVADNNLEGDIPQAICRLKNLTVISVAVNKLCGTFPSCLYNLSSLIWISAAENHFNGTLPPNMFHTLPNLYLFIIDENQISGPIPTSIANASSLINFGILKNQFVGQVPRLGKLQDLYKLNLESNNLGDNSTKDFEFLKSMRNCTKLRYFSISRNNFGGNLPSSIGNLSTQLSYLYLEGNQISGKIPAELGNLNGLILLTMHINHLEGIIPATFGMFQKMQVLSLYQNKLSRDIPTTISNLSQLYHLDLGHNMLEGNIPSSIGNCQKLQYLDLSQNFLRGTIPSKIFGLVSLSNLLDLSQNSLSGSIAEEIGMLKNLIMLNVSENHLSDDIPGTIGECISLEHLHLQGNSFHGIIPSSLASLKDLQSLDLSRNQLSGSIPKGLQSIAFLEDFNISFNMLEGEVPTEGVFQNASALVVTGNKNLCGGILELHLPPCPVKGMKPAKHHIFKLMAVIVSVVVFLLILFFILIIYRMRKRNRKQSVDSPQNGELAKVSYQSLHNATNGFLSENLIGSGNFGSVYKGTLESEGGVVAIKVLNLQKKGAHKSFIAECNVLINIRHRNLLKILTCCSSIDYKGHEFKALIFEYMKNGSLESWLHPTTETTDQPKSLNLEQRLNVIADVASAFHYLHYECKQPVIHCDLKPSNILLDDCMVAHVGDFGLSRLLSSVGVSLMHSSTIGIKGTVGYAPPEYGMGSKVSIEGDMYSFGVLVLEMLTGKRPTEETFKDGLNLHNYVKLSIPDRLLQIVDPTILPSGLEHNINNGNFGIMHPNVEKCLLSLFRIALACSVELPKERMSMVDVRRELNIIKSFFHIGV